MGLVADSFAARLVKLAEERNRLLSDIASCARSRHSLASKQLEATERTNQLLTQLLRR